MLSLFVWKMAWRDSRSSRRRLLLHSVSITLGVAALVGIGLFRQNLALAIDDQAKTLVGADLIVESSREFHADEETFLRSLGEPQAREVRFMSMVAFPHSNQTHLAHVRALAGDFPFYGRMETAPAEATRDLRENRGVIVDESLLIQFHAVPGDPIKIGDAEFTIAGALKKMPGEASAAGSFAPRVYLPLQKLAETHLLRPGSVARYRNYLKFPPGTNIDERIAQLEPQIQKFGLEFETVAKRKKDLGSSLENLYRFLGLVGFVALLLGAIGVASAIHAHLQQKMKTGAVLRCLGASAKTILSIYLLQAAAMGLIGAAAGGALGVALQGIFPRVLQTFLPFTIPASLTWRPIAGGMFVGFAICVFFALPPLLRFRRVSPLLLLRGPARGEIDAQPRDLMIAAAYGLIAASLVTLALSQSETWMRGLILSGALAVVFGIFSGVAKLFIVLVRKFYPQRASFEMRQGLANLYRPNNRTFLVTLSLGLGTFLLLNLYLTRDVLLDQFRSIGANNQPNIFLFDIQPEQTAAVSALVRSQGLPIIQRAPIVTMRLAEIKGRKTSDILADPNRKIENWELEREYRSTYREELTETEKIVDGRWIGRVNYRAGDVVPISIEQEIAKDFGAKVGDELLFDVQGVPMKTSIASVRKVDWKRFQTNFFVVFPVGVLEGAPSFNVLVSRVPTPSDSARLQSAIVAQFPNVSALDLTSVIETVDSILTKVALVIRVMSIFTVGVGLIVLASTIWSGRYQRVQESILLRTLGASRWQIWKILCAEYFFLGALSSLTAILLASLSSWALAEFVFKLPFILSILPLVCTALLVIGLTIVIGLATSRGIGNSPPLDVLRAEAE